MTLPIPGLNGTSSAPTVRRPALQVSFGAASGGGGLSGLASAVGGALGVSLGGASDAWAQNLVLLTVECGLAPFADVAEIYLAASASAPSANVGDSGSIALGYEDDTPAPVFSGTVDAVRYRIYGTTRITATNGGATLARLRVNQSYEQQNAGQIVGDLIGRAEVAAGTVEDGVDLPFYVVDSHGGAYQQIAALARRSGYLAYIAPDGTLHFVPATGGDPQYTFSYSNDILALQAEQSAPALGAVTIVGEGAAGSHGTDAWSWLVKDPSSVTGSAGDGTPALQTQDGALRSVAAAGGAASALNTAAGMVGVSGRLLVPGAPQVSAGGTFEISGAPQEALNGRFLARRVRHRFSKGEGFVTLIGFSKLGE